jgi:hypothetical protein
MHNGQIFNAMIEFFEEDEWDFTWLEDMPVLSMNFSGRSGKWICYAQAREDQEQFVFYSVCPVNVPEDRRPVVAEYITRANYGMIIGNFEMDYVDGEVRYKTSIDVEGANLLAPLVKQLVYANVVTMDRYLPGIMTVIYGNASPEAEIERIESTLSSESDESPDDSTPVTSETDDDPDDTNHTNGSSPE